MRHNDLSTLLEGFFIFGNKTWKARPTCRQNNAIKCISNYQHKSNWMSWNYCLPSNHKFSTLYTFFYDVLGTCHKYPLRSDIPQKLALTPIELPVEQATTWRGPYLPPPYWFHSTNYIVLNLIRKSLMLWNYDYHR